MNFLYLGLIQFAAGFTEGQLPSPPAFWGGNPPIPDKFNSYSITAEPVLQVPGWEERHSAAVTTSSWRQLLAPAAAPSAQGFCSAGRMKSGRSEERLPQPHSQLLRHGAEAPLAGGARQPGRRAARSLLALQSVWLRLLSSTYPGSHLK